MNKVLFWLIFAGFSFCSCAQKSRPKRISVVQPLFAVDTTKPIIESGFYLVSEDSATSIKRYLYNFLKEESPNGDYYLDSSNLIPFTAIESVSGREDTVFNTGFYVLEFKLNSQAAKQLAKLSANANQLRLSTPNGLRLGIVADNTLVQVVGISNTVAGGVMELSYMYSQEDVENLKRNFDKSISTAKSNR